MLVSSAPCGVSGVPWAQVAEAAQHRGCEAAGPLRLPRSLPVPWFGHIIMPAERPNPPRWPRVRKRAPPRGSRVRELGGILGVVLVINRKEEAQAVPAEAGTEPHSG